MAATIAFMYETIISEDKLEAIWEDVLSLYKITYNYRNK